MFFLIHILNLLSFTFGSYSINVFPNPLSKEEEEKLIKKMMNNDREARNKLIEHNYDSSLTSSKNSNVSKIIQMIS